MREIHASGVIFTRELPEKERKQRFINFGKPLEDCGVGGEVLTHFDEGADDVHAHGDGALAIENGGGH